MSSPADSTPAEPAEQAASTDASTPPASEPGKGKGVKARSAELDAEIADLQQKLKTRATLREELQALGVTRTPDASPAASSPAPARTLTATVEQPDITSPLLTEEQFFGAFPDAAYGQYAVYAGRYAARAEFAQLQQVQAQQHARQQWDTKVEEIRKEYPDFHAVVSTAFASLPATPANDALAGAIQDLNDPRLLYHLATHVEEAERLVTLSPPAALLELGRISASLRTPVTPRKPTSSAPTPPTTLGSKAADPGDELDTAVANGDMARFKELRLARRVALTR